MEPLTPAAGTARSREPKSNALEYYCYIESWTLAYVFHSLAGTFRFVGPGQFFGAFVGANERSLLAMPLEALGWDTRSPPGDGSLPAPPPSRVVTVRALACLALVAFSHRCLRQESGINRHFIWTPESTCGRGRREATVSGTLAAALVLAGVGPGGVVASWFDASRLLPVRSSGGAGPGFGRAFGRAFPPPPGRQAPGRNGGGWRAPAGWPFGAEQPIRRRSSDVGDRSPGGRDHDRPTGGSSSTCAESERLLLFLPPTAGGSCCR